VIHFLFDICREACEYLIQQFHNTGIGQQINVNTLLGRWSLPSLRL